MTEHHQCCECIERLRAAALISTDARNGLRAALDREYERAHKALVARDRLAATLDQVRVALAGHPRCEEHAGDDPITCGWKRAVLDVQAAIEGTDS